MSLYSYMKIGDIKSAHGTETVAGVNVKDLIECISVDVGGFQKVDDRRTIVGEQVMTPVKVRFHTGKETVDVFKEFTTNGGQSNNLKVEIQMFHYSHVGDQGLEKMCDFKFEGAKLSAWRFAHHENSAGDAGQRPVVEIEFLYNKVTLDWKGDGTQKSHVTEWSKR